MKIWVGFQFWVSSREYQTSVHAGNTLEALLAKMEPEVGEAYREKPAWQETFCTDDEGLCYATIQEVDPEEKV